MPESTISQPEVTINLVGDTQTVQNSAHKVLIVGQQTSAGSATSGELQQQIQNAGEETGLFGADSMIAAMIRAFKQNNQVTRVDAIGLDDASGTAATGTVTYTGTASAAGSSTVVIGSEKNHSFTIAIPDTSTPTEIGDLLVTAINADANVPVTAANVTGVVTMTAVNVGTFGNEIGISASVAATSVTVAVAAMASGATDPTLTTLFDPVDTERYQTVIYPENWGLTALTDFLDPRFNTTNDVLDGVGIATDVDTFANLTTAGNAENSESLVLIGVALITETLYKAPGIFELPTVISANFGALRALRLTEDANIADIVSARTGPADSFGGVHLSSKPYFNTPFANLPLIGVGHGFSRVNIEALVNTSGVTSLGNNIAGNQLIAGEVVSTYKTDSGGNPDTSFKFLNSVDTGTAAREFFFNNVRAEYAQSRLTDGDLIPLVSSANESSVRAFLIGLYSQLTEPEFALTRSGEANLNIFRDGLSITLDLSTGKVTGDMSVPIITQFRTFNGTLRIRF